MARGNLAAAGCGVLGCFAILCCSCQVGGACVARNCSSNSLIIALKGVARLGGACGGGPGGGGVACPGGGDPGGGDCGGDPAKDEPAECKDGVWLPEDPCDEGAGDNGGEGNG